MPIMRFLLLYVMLYVQNTFILFLAWIFHCRRGKILDSVETNTELEWPSQYSYSRGWGMLEAPLYVDPSRSCSGPSAKTFYAAWEHKGDFLLTVQDGGIVVKLFHFSAESLRGRGDPVMSVDWIELDDFRALNDYIASCILRFLPTTLCM